MGGSNNSGGNPLFRFLQRHFTRRVYVFLACLLISSIIWILMSLSSHYTTVLDIPVSYKGTIENKTITGDPRDHLSIEVRGYGFDLLSYKLFPSFKKPVIPVDEMKILRKNGEQKAYITGNTAVKEISGKIKEDMQVKRIFPDTIFVNIDDIGKKEVPVRTSAEASYASQYDRSGSIEVEPDSVLIEGPASVLDTLRFLRTENVVFEELEETTTRSVDLQVPASLKNASIEPERITITIPVDQFTEGVKTISVQLNNRPKGWQIKIFPDSVSVHYNVALSDYDRVRKDMFKAVVQLKSPALLEKLDHLEVTLADQPAFVREAWHEPREVEFLIKRE